MYTCVYLCILVYTCVYLCIFVYICVYLRVFVCPPLPYIDWSPPTSSPEAWCHLPGKPKPCKARFGTKPFIPLSGFLHTTAFLASNTKTRNNGSNSGLSSHLHGIAALCLNYFKFSIVICHSFFKR